MPNAEEIARTEMVEDHEKRIKALEDLANDKEGLPKKKAATK